MAQQHAKHHYQNLTKVLFIFLIMSSLSSASARLFPRDYLSQRPAHNPSEKEARYHVLPCHTDQTESNTKQQQQPEIMGFEASSGTPRFGAAAAKYGPLILNLLPKGTKPPSGPSKGTNNLNN